MYEHRKQPLAPLGTFYQRVLKNLVIAFLVLAISLGIGILGYSWSAGMSGLDALLNASMILSGMGPVETHLPPAGKWFASAYALFSGVVFITNVGIILAPVMHRLFHRLNLENN
jgi:hypothetical protein